jgi:hypothetical protein
MSIVDILQSLVIAWLVWKNLGFYSQIFVFNLAVYLGLGFVLVNLVNLVFGLF